MTFKFLGPALYFRGHSIHTLTYTHIHTHTHTHRRAQTWIGGPRYSFNYFLSFIFKREVENEGDREREREIERVRRHKKEILSFSFDSKG